MRKISNPFFLVFIFLCFIHMLNAQGLIIQENETGFCSIDGIIENGVTGYTGEGFANAGYGAGVSALWNVNVDTDGTYHILWQYANGGGAGDLLAEVWINEEVFIDEYSFQHTEKWTMWEASDTIEVNLIAGNNKIRLVSISENGLANIDYFKVLEDNVEPAFCLPSYSLNMSVNDAEGGVVSYEPVQVFYDEGTEITLTAEPNSGYFFQSWSDGETSENASHTFKIKKNADVEALFFPDGTEAVEGVKGYATVQDDQGTPYLMLGGTLGETVVANSFASLKNYLESEEPLVIEVENHIIATGQINIKSHKSLVGTTDSAHLEGIRLKVSGSKNIIFQNIAFSKVIQYDAMELNASTHIWIDQCEFFSDRDHDKDYYDGLLDIKNGARFITISNTHFHDHFKAVLIGSGDDGVQDTVIRITFHHNFFNFINSRTPLMRFGKAHMFNNYFLKCGSGINSRMGACLRVEKNYFKQVNNATRTDMSAEVGNFQLIDNIFESSSHTSEPVCELDIPYEYESILDETEEVPGIITGNWPTHLIDVSNVFEEVKIFPNPTAESLNIIINAKENQEVAINMINLLGNNVLFLGEKFLHSGRNEFSVDVSDLKSGIYILQFLSNDELSTHNIIIEH